MTLSICSELGVDLRAFDQVHARDSTRGSPLFMYVGAPVYVGGHCRGHKLAPWNVKTILTGQRLLACDEYLARSPA